MTDPLIARAEHHEYQQLFLHDLNWSKPDHPPITCEYDGRAVTATNVSSYKGLRVWVIDEKPESHLEAAIDRAIAQTTTDRIVIFHDDIDQVWRWPVRRMTGNGTATRLSRHKHHTGDPDPRFAAKLAAIRLPFDDVLDTNAVLAKIRAAFDVEAQNETKHASKLMARLYTAMEKAYPTGANNKDRDHQISVTLARILFLMFGDDTDMWRQHPDLFRNFIHQHTAADGSDIGAQLTDLFAYLDTPPAERLSVSDHLDGFRYANGGIFRERISLPKINAEFRDVVLDACGRDWATISPAIFGSMFQSVRDAKTRRELGEHYTSEENILKTLNPLFLDELRADFVSIEPGGRYEADRLNKLREKLGRVRYMDPACGCGNFIIVAYRELRDLELTIMERLRVLPSGQRTTQFLANEGLKVTLDHFFGIEIDEWPARIAETAMFLIDRQCDLKLTERLGWAPDRLPIQEQATIVVGNALRIDWADICPPTTDVVIAGNPPFLGDSSRTREQLADLQGAWGGDKILSRLDYVTGWHAQTLNYFHSVDGRWAFVTTNSITQGDPVARLFGEIFTHRWRIKFAHRTFAWSSEAAGGAAVHCVIIGFTRRTDFKPLLYTYATLSSTPVATTAANINAYLFDGADVLVDKRTKPLYVGLPQASKGSEPADGGFLLVSRADYEALRLDPAAAKFLRPFRGARELLWNEDRWCLWMVGAEKPELMGSAELIRRIEGVRQARLDSRSDIVRQSAATPHLFRIVKQPSVPYVCIPRHVSEARRYFPVARYPESVICGDANFLAPDPDGLLFALISSSMFLAWQRAVGGRIKSDLRFGSTLTWNTLPLPPVSDAQRERIIAAGRQVEMTRALHPEQSLAEQYSPGRMSLKLVEAHDQLDEYVDQAFGAKNVCGSERERQKILFARYAELIAPRATS